MTRYILEGCELELLRNLLNQKERPLYSLRIDVREEGFAYKVNEGGWSPTVGEVQR
jgi:hypothetical protein